MNNYELDAWLGDNTVTEKQRAALIIASDEVDVTWPGPDLEDSRLDAFNGAAAFILGDITIEMAHSAWRESRAKEREAMRYKAGTIIGHEALRSQSGIEEHS